jgi:hypothetical protein
MEKEKNSAEEQRANATKSNTGLSGRRLVLVVLAVIAIAGFAVIIATTAAVVGLVNFKDYANRTEAMRAMEQLGQMVLRYREVHGSVPAQFYVDEVKKELEGSARLGALKYRARWIEYGATGNEILAYTRKDYGGSILGGGYIVLRLDGRVEWMKEKEFEALLDSQQSLEEKRLGDHQF